jgi:hypothetical protein
MFSLVEHLDGNLAALRTFLTCASRIDLDDRPTSFRSFVVEHRDQLRPRGVMDMLGVHSTRQAFDIEFLHTNSAEAVNKASGKLMQIIAPLVGDVCFVLGFEKPNLTATFRALPATSERPRPLAQPFGGSLGEVWSRQRFAVRQGDETGKADINADRCALRVWPWLLAGGLLFFAVVEAEKLIIRSSSGLRNAVTAVEAGA